MATTIQNLEKYSIKTAQVLYGDKPEICLRDTNKQKDTRFSHAGGITLSRGQSYKINYECHIIALQTSVGLEGGKLGNIMGERNARGEPRITCPR